jgi:hypothetical protein
LVLAQGSQFRPPLRGLLKVLILNLALVVDNVLN